MTTSKRVEMKRVIYLILGILIVALYYYGESTSEANNTRNGAEVNIEQSDAEAGNPPSPLLPASREDQPELILERTAYTVCYNKETRQPNWVAWTITKGNVTESNMIVDRPVNAPFHEDEETPSPRATLDDYRGSGWTRGHMCPAGDCRWREDVQYESFLLSNVSPQSRALNAGVWNDIEKSCRRWALRYGKVYVVSGPIFFKKSEKGYIGRNKVKVPDAFFKVILCTDSKEPKGIGFVCRNENGAATVSNSGDAHKRTKKEMYIHSIDEVERITGYDFFPALPDDVEEKVEATANYEEW